MATFATPKMFVYRLEVLFERDARAFQARWSWSTMAKSTKTASRAAIRAIEKSKIVKDLRRAGLSWEGNAVLIAPK